MRHPLFSPLLLLLLAACGPEGTHTEDAPAPGGPTDLGQGAPTDLGPSTAMDLGANDGALAASDATGRPDDVGDPTDNDFDTASPGDDAGDAAMLSPMDGDQPPLVDTGPGPVEDLGPAPTEDAGPPPGCAPGVPNCTCVGAPPPGEGCTHTFGGRYSEGGCSANYQCCGGQWQHGVDVCGPCSCREPSGEVGCAAAGGEQDCFPSFIGEKRGLTAAERAAMSGVAWRAGCPVGLDELVVLELVHWNYAGELARGRLVVAASVADDLLAAFREVYDARFPIARIEPVEAYDGDDDRSMAANNSSAFNCRRVTGGNSWSRHSYGTALDINPVQNPYVRGATILPPAAAAYTDRGDARPGMVLDPGPVVAAFRRIGWGWGGDWASPLDYQHFSSDGR